MLLNVLCSCFSQCCVCGCLHKTFYAFSKIEEDCKKVVVLMCTVLLTELRKGQTALRHSGSCVFGYEAMLCGVIKRQCWL